MKPHDQLYIATAPYINHRTCDNLEFCLFVESSSTGGDLSAVLFLFASACCRPRALESSLTATPNHAIPPPAHHFRSSTSAWRRYKQYSSRASTQKYLIRLLYSSTGVFNERYTSRSRVCRLVNSIAPQHEGYEPTPT